MFAKGKITVLASIVVCCLIETQGADKYTDGNRPYEFGFSIDGEQHRHEKKDERGLIMGEFGFITADGVYHVTVYATDEQGRFKILSMKNIRVKPYPTYTNKQSTSSARQGHSLELPASPETLIPPVVSTTQKPLSPISIEPPARSCSHCSLPTTSTPAPVAPALSQPISNSPNLIEAVESPKFPQGVKPPAYVGQQNNANIPFPQQRFGGESAQQPNSAQNYPVQPQQELVAPQEASPNLPQQNTGPGSSVRVGTNIPESSPQGPAFDQPQNPVFPQQPPQIGVNSPIGRQNSNPEDNSQPDRGTVASGRTPKRLNGEPSFGSVEQPNSIQNISPNNAGSSQNAPVAPKRPTLISAQMQIVDKNTDIHRRGPGENEGLPEGLTKDDMSQLLYTFNYTVGFHGHFEEGYTNGVKQGYYFVTGRNGVKTRVDYVADSKGFHPKISQEVLDLLSDDVPKPETEKEPKYGLKGYEFKWLYYPVEAKGR